MQDEPSHTMFTIGHSTRTLAELVAILKSHDVSVLADVRTVPRSRHVPQFNAETDYMQTPAFRAGLEQLIRIASARPTAIMCAEAVPWRCHRSLIADALIVRGWRVFDLMSERSAKLHNLTDFGKVEGTTHYLSVSPLELARGGAPRGAGHAQLSDETRPLDREATMKRSVKKQRRSGSGMPFVRGPFDLGGVPLAGKVHQVGSTRRGGGRLGRALRAPASDPPAPTAQALARWENEGGSPAPRPISDRARKTKATHAPKKSVAKHSAKKSKPRRVPSLTKGRR